MLRINDLPYNDPDLAWQVIVEVFARTQSDEVLGVASALLLEGLLRCHGERYIELIEAAAERVPLFRQYLGKVWLDSEDTAVWRRVYEIAGVTPPFPEGWRDDPTFKRNTET